MISYYNQGIVPEPTVYLEEKHGKTPGTNSPAFAGLYI
jgi:hypothetical protein